MRLRRAYPEFCSLIEPGMIAAHRGLPGPVLVIRPLGDGETVMGTDGKPFKCDNKRRNKYFCMMLNSPQKDQIVCCFDIIPMGNVKFYTLAIK